MKMAIIKVINGNFFVHAEGITDLGNAKTIFHGLCQTLWNASDVLSAYVMIADEQLDAVEGYKEYIHHDPVPEVEPEEPAEEPEG
jgi:hypothetical protein